MTDTLQAARESFSGKTMTESQLIVAVAITDILDAEIKRSGSFIEKLTDYSHAFARNEKFDAPRAEKMIRDIYTASRGQSMNQTRESLQASAENLPDIARTRALDRAESVAERIQSGPTQPYYLALDQASRSLAEEFGITQNMAKELMSDTFEQHHGKELYAHGKEVEEAYHKPVREAEIAARKVENLQSRSQRHSYG